MTNRTFEADVADWLGEGPDTGPRHGLEHALAAARRIEQRPGWVFPGRYVPRRLQAFPVPAGTGVAVGLLAALLVLVALAFAIAGNRVPPRLPFVPAADRPIAFQEGAAIYVAHRDGSGRHRISGDVPFAYGPIVSPDGAWVAFLAPAAADETGGRLLVAPIDGSKAPIDAGHGRSVVSGQVPSVSWSPDGRDLAFAAADGGVSRIFVTRGIGGDVAPITDGTVAADLPTWSPDGTRIAFRVTEPDGVHRHIWIAHPDGSGLESLNDMVARDSAFGKPSFSPVNGQLAYAVNYGFGSRTRALVDSGSTHTTELWADGLGGYAEASIPFSPDGRYVAFITASDGVIVADDPVQQGAGNPTYVGELRRLGHVADCWVDWVPDGTALYGGSADGCTGVVVIPLDDPGAAYRLPTATSGFASWQRLLR